MTALTLKTVEYCEGPVEGGPVAILHGLFGSGRNWATIAQRLAVHRRVITLDLRNHGASPWAEAMNYPAMAEDVVATLRALGHERATLIGHSMGGKAAMAAALWQPGFVERLVVVDIAPVTYSPRHLDHVEAMRGLDLSQIRRRSEADAALAAAMPDAAERAFLLQNIIFPETGEARWRLNLAAIERSMPDLVGWPAPSRDTQYAGPALFLAGGRSEYVRPEHEAAIRRLFPNAQIAQIPGAGHWLHAERPQALLDAVEPFLARG